MKFVLMIFLVMNVFFESDIAMGAAPTIGKPICSGAGANQTCEELLGIVAGPPSSSYQSQEGGYQGCVNVWNSPTYQIFYPFFKGAPQSCPSYQSLGQWRYWSVSGVYPNSTFYAPLIGWP